MPRHRSVEERVTEHGMSGVFDYVFAGRKVLERAWDSDTMYQGIVPSLDDPASRGQCGVSSVWLSRRLSDLGVNTLFTEGRIHLGDMTAEHVWVEVRDVSDEPLIADIASDQYQNLLGAKIHVGRYGHDTGISYEPLTHFEPYDIPRKKLMARYALLEANINNLPRRHRKLVR